MERKYISGAVGLATYLNVSRFLAEKIIADGLPSYRIDRKFIFRSDQVDTFMERYSTTKLDANVERLTLKLMGGSK
jgi:hypothetical protein